MPKDTRSSMSSIFPKSMCAEFAPNFLLMDLLRGSWSCSNRFHNFRWQAKTDVFRHDLHFADCVKTFCLQDINNLFNQNFRRGCACRKRNSVLSGEPL